VSVSGKGNRAISPVNHGGLKKEFQRLKKKYGCGFCRNRQQPRRKGEKFFYFRKKRINCFEEEGILEMVIT